MTSKFYSREILKRIAGISAPLINNFTGKQKIEMQNEGEYHPVFIIGAPRTGSTILYQIISNELDILYIDNLIDAFYRNFLWAFKLSDKLFNAKSHNCFKSIHGNTWKCGLHAPSECGEFWYQWLPREKHFIDYKDTDSIVMQSIQTELYSVINFFDKPLLMKNLNAGQRLRLLCQVCPDAKFISVVRDKIDTANSILNSRRKSGVKEGDWWSVKPKDFENLLGLNEHEMVIRQIYYLEKQISEDIKLFPSSNYIVINYDEINENYISVVNKVKNFIGGKIQFRTNRVKPGISGSKNIMDNSDITLLKKYYQKLDWDKLNIEH